MRGREVDIVGLEIENYSGVAHVLKAIVRCVNGACLAAEGHSPLREWGVSCC